MKLLLFFLSIVFVLLFGNGNLLAESGFSIDYQSSSLNSNSNVSKCIHTGFASIYFINFTQSKENEILICEEVEDPDSDASSSRKGRLVNGLLIVFYDKFYVDYPHHCVKAFPLLWRNTSHKYILQGTLRI